MELLFVLHVVGVGCVVWLIASGVRGEVDLKPRLVTYDGPRRRGACTAGDWDQGGSVGVIGVEFRVVQGFGGWAIKVANSKKY